MKNINKTDRYRIWGVILKILSQLTLLLKTAVQFLDYLHKL